MSVWQSSTRLSDDQQHFFLLDQELGKGGEAVVWTIKGQPDIVAKLYHRPSPQHQYKLTAMLSSPPDSSGGHMTIVWPTTLLFNQRRFAGFLMPRLGSDSQPIFKFYNPAVRRQISPNFNWKYLHRTAMNLAIAVSAVHTKGHLIGDVNESNILVNDRALVTVVDTDSFQIREPSNHQVYPCRVGKPEYTPPELQGVDLKTVTRQEPHDLFGLSVLIFQLLMEGFHPFSGVLRSHASVGRVDLYCIQQGMFPYQNNSLVSPNPNAPFFYILHPDVQAAFLRCFVQGYRDPTQRPTAREWQTILETAENALVTCSHNSSHFYSNHLSECPWCKADQPQQKPLPPISTSLPPVSISQLTSVPLYKKKANKTLLWLAVFLVSGVVLLLVNGLTASPATRPTVTSTPFPSPVSWNSPNPSKAVSPAPIFTPTPISSSAGTVTPTIPATYIPEAVVTTSRLNMRVGPGAQYEIVSKYDEGTTLVILGTTAEGDWLKVKSSDGTVGWMSAEFLKFDIVLATLPLVEIPPTPTPSPQPTSPPTAISMPSLIGHEYQTKYFIFSVIGSPTRMKSIHGQYMEGEAEGIFLIVPIRWRNTSQISRYIFLDEPDTCIISQSRQYRKSRQVNEIG